MQSGIGFSTSRAAVKAGRLAAGQAVQRCGQPDLTLLFTAGDYDPADVLAGVQTVIGSSNLVGASTFGIITREGILKSGVGVCCLCGSDIRAVTYLQQRFLTEGSAYTDKIKIGPLPRYDSRTAGTVFVFPNGFGNNISALLRQLHDSIGPGYNYVGGGTGDNLGLSRSYQITDQGIATDGFALALVHGIDFNFGLAHSWVPMGEPMQVTKAIGKRVYELDGMPAFSRYAASLGGLELRDFPQVCMKHPLGILGKGGEFLIRDPLQVEADGSIVFVTEIPPNTVATMMTPSREDNLSREARKMMFSTFSSLPQPKVMFIFDCVSRYYLMGADLERRLVCDLKAVDPSVSVLGFLSFGEISSTSGVPLFHNKCIAVTVGG
ncbi:MAG: histidine kinase [Firmicutes bacterium]|nr:histidine kinase [Bacillota bacterium]